MNSMRPTTHPTPEVPDSGELPLPASIPGETPLREAFRVGGVVFGGFVVLGMGLGVLISSLGLPWWLAPVLSLAVYAGSVEFLLVGLLAAGVPLPGIAATTFLVNSRHLVYGLSFPLERVRGRWAKLYAIFSLSDEQYALNVGPDSLTHRSARILWVGFLLHMSWALGSTLGAVLGAGFLADLKGVDFVMTALFIILAIDSYRAVRDNVTATLALLSAAIAVAAFPHGMLTMSLLLFVAMLVLRHLLGGRRATR